MILYVFEFTIIERILKFLLKKKKNSNFICILHFIRKVDNIIHFKML